MSDRILILDGILLVPHGQAAIYRLEHAALVALHKAVEREMALRQDAARQEEERIVWDYNQDPSDRL